MPAGMHIPWAHYQEWRLDQLPFVGWLSRVLITSIVVGQNILSLVGVGGLPRCVSLCSKPCIEAIQRIWKGGLLVRGKWRCPVVGDDQGALPHASYVSSVLEVAVDSLSMCTLCHSDGPGQAGPCCSQTWPKAVCWVLSSVCTSVVILGLWLGCVTIVLETVTSPMHL